MDSLLQVKAFPRDTLWKLKLLAASKHLTLRELVINLCLAAVKEMRTKP
jgi:hypothetical protein